MKRVATTVAALTAASIALVAVAQPTTPKPPARVPPAPGAPAPKQAPTPPPAAPAAPVKVAPQTPAVPAGAIDPSAPPNPPVHPAEAGLRFERVWHDFGKIPDTESVKCVFKFANSSKDKTITIANVQTSCGCTTPGLTKKTYAPGESGEIEITFNPLGKHGLERKTISVYSDDKSAEKLDLLIVSNVLQRVIIEPQSLFMGEQPLRYSGMPSQELSITGRMKDFAITSMTNTNDKYNVQQIGQDQIEIDGEKLNRYRYKVTLAPNLPFGVYQSNIALKTNDPVRQDVVVMVTGSVVGKVALNLDRVPVQFRQPGDPFAIDVYLNSRENPPKPFEVLKVETTKPKDMVIVTDVLPQVVGTKNGYRVRIAGTVGSTPITGNIKIHTNVPDQEVIELPLVPMQIGVPPKPMVQGKPIEMTPTPGGAVTPSASPQKPTDAPAGH